MNVVNADESHAGNETPCSHAHAPLGVWDAVALILGIVIGTTIFRAPPLIFQNVSGPMALIGAWLLGGVLSFAGALCFAELATLFPRSGGDYHYLTHSYGRWAGFLFGWVQLTFVQPSNIAAMAFAFATYANSFSGGQFDAWQMPIAGGLILLLTGVNIVGVHLGKWVQNLLAVIKAGALLLILLAAAMAPAPVETIEPLNSKSLGFGFAMIFVLFAMGGWNDAALVASEVKDRERNLPRALFWGLGIVTGLYLLVNLAYWRALGFEGVRHSEAPAADVLRHLVGTNGGRVMSVLVMISAMGTVNGLIFSISRLHAAVGADHPLLAKLGEWHPRTRTPVWALLIQAAIAGLFIFTAGSEWGQSLIDRGHQAIGLPAVDWKLFNGGFETMVAGSAPVFWLFFLAAGLSVFVLRWMKPEAPRPFRVPFYPLPSLLFCGMCGYMLYVAVEYARTLLPMAMVPLLTGLIAYAVSNSWRRDANRSAN